MSDTIKMQKRDAGGRPVGDIVDVECTKLGEALKQGLKPIRAGEVDLAADDAVELLKSAADGRQLTKSSRIIMEREVTNEDGDTLRQTRAIQPHQYAEAYAAGWRPQERFDLGIEHPSHGVSVCQRKTWKVLRRQGWKKLAPTPVPQKEG